MNSNGNDLKEGSLDPAKYLAETFKKEGHLDSLKNEILSQNVEGDISLDEFIKSRVRDLVRDRVNEDESLIFKNRGTTTALLEGQLFKDGFKSLNTSNIDVEKLLSDSLDDATTRQKIRTILEAKTNDS